MSRNQNFVRNRARRLDAGPDIATFVLAGNQNGEFSRHGTHPGAKTQVDVSKPPGRRGQSHFSPRPSCGRYPTEKSGQSPAVLKQPVKTGRRYKCRPRQSRYFRELRRNPKNLAQAPSLRAVGDLEISLSAQSQDLNCPDVLACLTKPAACPCPASKDTDSSRDRCTS